MGRGKPLKITIKANITRPQKGKACQKGPRCEWNYPSGAGGIFPLGELTRWSDHRLRHDSIDNAPAVRTQRW